MKALIRTALAAALASGLAAAPAGAAQIVVVHGHNTPDIGGVDLNKGAVYKPLIPDIDSKMAGLPEPATWLMLLAGFGAIGAAARRRKVSYSFA